MDLDLVHARWVLGLYPADQIPEFAAQAMMQGHDGPNILELVSFHRPSRHDIRPEVFDAAIREMGRVPMSPSQAIYFMAKEPSGRFLRNEIDLSRFEADISRLSNQRGASEEFQMLGSVLWALTDEPDGDEWKRQLLVEWAWKLLVEDPGR